MAHIRKITRANGAIKYNAEILVKKDGVIIHRESKIFDKQKQANDWGIIREAELKKNSIYGETEYLPIKQIIAQYIKQFDPQGRTKLFDLMKLQKREIAKIDVNKLNAKDLIKHITIRNTECKPQTAQNDLIWLGQILSTMRPMMDYKYDPEIFVSARDILRRERLIAKSEHRERRPTKGEIWKLARYFKGHWMLPVMYFSIYSARRLSETVRIDSADINHDNRTCIIRNLKDPRNKSKTAICKLPKQAYRILMKYGKPTGACFPYNRKTVSKYFTDACKVLGINDLHFHDLRHEATSLWFERGLAINEVAQITLHTDWKTLKRYTNLNPGDLDI